MNASKDGWKSTNAFMCISRQLRPPGERFFRDLTENRIRRGIFRDLEQLITAIGEYIDRHNESPKPFIWTAKANDILEKVTRARVTLDKRLD